MGGSGGCNWVYMWGSPGCSRKDWKQGGGEAWTETPAVLVPEPGSQLGWMERRRNGPVKRPGGWTRKDSALGCGCRVPEREQKRVSLFKTLFTLAEGVEHLTANFCLHLYRFPRADLTQLPETRWLESTEIYSLIVLETRSLPWWCQWARLPKGSRGECFLVSLASGVARNPWRYLSLPHSSLCLCLHVHFFLLRVSVSKSLLFLRQQSLDLHPPEPTLTST